tara:strand:- start:3349 stop:3639 length:291 start_codon:yes stop_codon:yes gene_type:complete
MNKETYEKYLGKVQSELVIKSGSVFNGRGLSFATAMNFWRRIGNDFNDYDGLKGYKCDFLDKDGNVVGYALATSEGFYWEYPQLVVDIHNYENKLV